MIRSSCPVQTGTVTFDTFQYAKQLLQLAWFEIDDCGDPARTMPRWMLMCLNCEIKFQYAPIDDSRTQDRLLPLKPLFPIIGLEIKCPHCGHQATYQRTELFYEA